MGKLSAILLLVINLFNFAGYNLVFQYAISRSEARLIRQLDASKYTDNDLVIVKFRLHLPYHGPSFTERVDGEIEISGTHYNYVKRKVSVDTLYLYCIPNYEKTKLSQGQLAYSNQVGDSCSHTEKNDNHLLKKMKWGAEYSDDLTLFTNVTFTKALHKKSGFLLEIVPFPPIATPCEPPETA